MSSRITRCETKRIIEEELTPATPDEERVDRSRDVHVSASIRRSLDRCAAGGRLFQLGRCHAARGRVRGPEIGRRYDRVMGGIFRVAARRATVSAAPVLLIGALLWLGVPAGPRGVAVFPAAARTARGAGRPATRARTVLTNLPLDWGAR
jgi:hypothetical protein